MENVLSIARAVIDISWVKVLKMEESLDTIVLVVMVWEIVLKMEESLDTIVLAVKD